MKINNRLLKMIEMACDYYLNQREKYTNYNDIFSGKYLYERITEYKADMKLTTTELVDLINMYKYYEVSIANDAFAQTLREQHIELTMEELLTIIKNMNKQIKKVRAKLEKILIKQLNMKEFDFDKIQETVYKEVFNKLMTNFESWALVTADMMLENYHDRAHFVTLDEDRRYYHNEILKAIHTGEYIYTEILGKTDYLEILNATLDLKFNREEILKTIAVYWAADHKNQLKSDEFYKKTEYSDRWTNTDKIFYVIIQLVKNIREKIQEELKRREEKANNIKKEEV